MNAELQIATAAADLVARAEALGVNLTITRVSTEPFAMGRAIHVVETWPARHPPAVTDHGPES
jgi:hypothetical protein